MPRNHNYTRFREIPDRSMFIWFAHSSIEEIEVVEFFGNQMFRVFRGREFLWTQEGRHDRTLLRVALDPSDALLNSSLLVEPCSCSRHENYWYFHDNYLWDMLEQYGYGRR